MRTGVVEGFYGGPYKAHQREILIEYLSRLEGASFVYAPKNDPFHRLRWREDYPSDRWSSLSSNIDSAASKGVSFIFGISPWQFRDGESGLLRRKIEKSLGAGADGIAILFDDIPERADATLAYRQITLAAAALDGFDCSVLLCPSIYCMEFFERLDGSEYLASWREAVPSGWQSFWTGKGVISKELDSTGLAEATELLGSKPVIWDNLLADDYTLRRIYLSGLEGRIPGGYSYYLNPSSSFLVALHGVYRLLLASGQSCEFPPELGDTPRAWEILGSFNHLPWQAGEEAGALFPQLEAALLKGPSGELLERLECMSQTLGSFINSLEELDGGFELLPYAVDLKKYIYWWKSSLALPSQRERIEKMKYMVFERLPYDHPLSTITTELLLRNGKGEE